MVPFTLCLVLGSLIKYPTQNQGALIVIWLLGYQGTKAEQRGFTAQAQEILALLEEEASVSASSASSQSSESVTDRELRNLCKTLARMSFSSLIGLAAHLPPSQVETQSPARLMAALETLRLQVPVETP